MLTRSCRASVWSKRTARTRSPFPVQRSRGPGLAGALIKLLGAPIAIAFDALLIAGSVLLLRGIRVDESLADRPAASFMRQLRDGLRFVFPPGCCGCSRCLWAAGSCCITWQSVVQILVATRELGMTAQAIGMCYVGMGVGTILASVYGKARQRTRRPWPHHRGGLRGGAAGWLALAVAPASVFGVVLFGSC